MPRRSVPNVLEDSTSSGSMIQRLAQDVDQIKNFEAKNNGNDGSENRPWGLSDHGADKDALMLKWEAVMGSKHTIVVG